MTATQRLHLRVQTWERESDRAQFNGDLLFTMLKHWKVKAEWLLDAKVGDGIKDPMKQCPTYRRIK